VDLVVLALVEDGANMDNPLDLSEVFLRFRLRNPGLADNWMDVDIRVVSKQESYGAVPCISIKISKLDEPGGDS
jgi:hypothetical protein